MVRSVANAHRTAASIYSGWRAHHSPGVWIHSTGVSVALICRMHEHIVIKCSIVAYTGRGSHARYHTCRETVAGEWHYQLHGRYWNDYCFANRWDAVQT